MCRPREGCLFPTQKMGVRFPPHLPRFFFFSSVDGAVAQLGERRVRNAEVRGSIPLCSTIAPRSLFLWGSRPTARPGSRTAGMGVRIPPAPPALFVPRSFGVVVQRQDAAPAQPIWGFESPLLHNLSLFPVLSGQSSNGKTRPLQPVRGFDSPLLHERFMNGVVAQLGERLHGMQEVAGSTPADSTTG